MWPIIYGLSTRLFISTDSNDLTPKERQLASLFAKLFAQLSDGPFFDFVRNLGTFHDLRHGIAQPPTEDEDYYLLFFKYENLMVSPDGSYYKTIGFHIERKDLEPFSSEERGLIEKIRFQFIVANMGNGIHPVIKFAPKIKPFISHDWSFSSEGMEAIINLDYATGNIHPKEICVAANDISADIQIPIEMIHDNGSH